MEIVDTNVLLIANGQHGEISLECQLTCIERLEAIKHNGSVAIDAGYLIVSEYRNKTTPNKGKRAGDTFLKWLLQNGSNPNCCAHVSLNETGADTFAEFPDPALQTMFDPPDRKFVAVANAHPDKPPILQAADCKWLNWRNDLATHGIAVDFVCPKDVKTFYAKKFPGKPIPEP